MEARNALETYLYNLKTSYEDTLKDKINSDDMEELKTSVEAALEVSYAYIVAYAGQLDPTLRLEVASMTLFLFVCSPEVQGLSIFQIQSLQWRCTHLCHSRMISSPASNENEWIKSWSVLGCHVHAHDELPTKIVQ